MKNITKEQLVNEVKKLNAEVAKYKKLEAEHKQIEQELELTQMSVDKMTDAVYWMGPDAKFVYVNEAAVKALGYSQDELLTMTVHDIGLEFPKEIWQDHWADLKKRDSFVFQTIHQRKDSSIFPVEITVNFIKFGDKELNCAIAKDITERKQAEDALRLKTNVFDVSVAAISTADSNGIIKECNNSFLKIWGYSNKGDVHGRPISDFLQYKEEAIKIIDSIRNTGVWEGEYVAKKKDNSTFIAYGLASDLRDSNNNLVGYQSSVTDITERKQAEEKLKARNTEMEILDQATVGRELVLIELKNEINKMLRKQGKKEKYKIPV